MNKKRRAEGRADRRSNAPPVSAPRIAYPELLDAQEADKAIGPPGYLAEDVERIRLARDLVKQEIEALPRSAGWVVEEEQET
jgi:hypothetical protein